jgi:hypothetical protein
VLLLLLVCLDLIAIAVTVLAVFVEWTYMSTHVSVHPQN